jgi:AcrR family transcriptional regulator
MQFKKEDIRANILFAAREEFWKNGFAKASIRSITAAAKTSKSNVYNYFQDKDALFAAVVETTITGVKKGFDHLRSGNPDRSAETYTIDSQKEMMRRIMLFVYGHQDDLKLLLFRSAGSSLSNFKDCVTNDLADVLADWVAYAAPERKLSRFFIRMVAGFYVGAIEQMLAKGVTAEQAAEHLNEFLHFVYGGWRSVLQTTPISEV